MKGTARKEALQLLRPEIKLWMIPVKKKNWINIS
jgi:hypothetical protein